MISPRILLLTSLLPTAALAEEPAWKPLFNGKDLSNWNTFIKGQPDGVDPERYFTVHDGMIHTYQDVPDTTTVTYGVIQTRESYSHFRLRFEYQWGRKKFAPRLADPRDAGVLFHCFQPDREKWTPGGFPLSFECQVQEHDTGDLWLVGSQGRVPLKQPLPEPPERPIYLAPAEGGVWTDGIINRVHRGAVSDTLEGWNRVETEVLGRNARFWVNGKLVMEVTDLEQSKDGTRPVTRFDIKEYGVPLSSGKIAFQCEAAEVFYRGIEIQVLPEDAKAGAPPK